MGYMPGNAGSQAVWNAWRMLNNPAFNFLFLIDSCGAAPLSDIPALKMGCERKTDKLHLIPACLRKRSSSRSLGIGP